jgi:hypothetical protein
MVDRGRSSPPPRAGPYRTTVDRAHGHQRVCHRVADATPEPNGSHNGCDRRDEHPRQDPPAAPAEGRPGARAAAQHRRRGVGARGDPAVRAHDVLARDRGGAATRGLLPRAPQPDLRRDARLYERSEPIDTVTVTDALRSAGTLEQAGGPEGVDLLAGAVPNVANLRQYAQIVRDTALLRRLLNTTYEIQSSVLDQREPARELVERAEQAMLEIAHGETQAGLPLDLSAAEERAGRAPRAVARRYGADRHPDRLRRPRRDDRRPAARQPDRDRRPPVDGQELPGHQHRRERRDQHGKPVALFSLEMSETELARRFIASQASIKGDDLSKGRVPRVDAGRRSSRRARGSPPRRCGSTTRATSACSRSAPRRAGCTPSTPKASAW